MNLASIGGVASSIVAATAAIQKSSVAEYLPDAGLKAAAWEFGAARGVRGCVDSGLGPALSVAADVPGVLFRVTATTA
jgi:hypothetical protein